MSPFRWSDRLKGKKPAPTVDGGFGNITDKIVNRPDGRGFGRLLGAVREESGLFGRPWGRSRQGPSVGGRPGGSGGDKYFTRIMNEPNLIFISNSNILKARLIPVNSEYEKSSIKNKNKYFTVISI